MFTRENGEPYRPAYVSRIFDTIVERLGLPHLPLHGLRHQHAALMIASGADRARLEASRALHDRCHQRPLRPPHAFRRQGSGGRSRGGSSTAGQPRSAHTAHTRPR